MNHKPFGLAMGPGAMRGLAHIGVLQVLEENGFKPSYIAGNSIGSLVGGLYVSGISPKDMQRTCLMINSRHMYDISGPKLTGLMSGSRLQGLVQTLTHSVNIEDACLPYGAAVVDLVEGELMYITRGPLYMAVRASCSIPGFFTPVKQDGHMLVDGGTLVGVPADLCRKLGAETVIGVDVSAVGHGSQPANAVDVLIRALMLTQHELYLNKHCPADLMLTPDVADCHALKWTTPTLTIQKGRDCAEQALPDIEKLLR